MKERLVNDQGLVFFAQFVRDARKQGERVASRRSNANFLLV